MTAITLIIKCKYIHREDGNSLERSHHSYCSCDSINVHAKVPHEETPLILQEEDGVRLAGVQSERGLIQQRAIRPHS
jgi:hypothetical protein